MHNLFAQKAPDSCCPQVIIKDYKSSRGLLAPTLLNLASCLSKVVPRPPKTPGTPHCIKCIKFAQIKQVTPSQTTTTNYNKKTHAPPPTDHRALKKFATPTLPVHDPASVICPMQILASPEMWEEERGTSW